MGLTGAKARRWLSLAAPLRPFWPLQEAVQCTDALTSPGSMLHPCLPPTLPSLQPRERVSTPSQGPAQRDVSGHAPALRTVCHTDICLCGWEPRR